MFLYIESRNKDNLEEFRAAARSKSIEGLSDSQIKGYIKALEDSIKACKKISSAISPVIREAIKVEPPDGDMIIYTDSRRKK